MQRYALTDEQCVVCNELRPADESAIVGGRSYRLTRRSLSRHRPHHITVRVARGTWNLRTQRCFAPIREAFAVAAGRGGFRVVHFSVQHNHVHMIVEARDRRSMSGALRSMLIRIARGINSV